MFSRRVAARVASLPTNSSAVVSPSSTSAAALSRTLSTTASQRKAPSLSDIAPDQAHTFAEKQKQFRDNLAELHRKKKEQERQSAASASTSSSSAIASASSVVNAASEAVSQGLGSLSTATGEAGRQKDAASGLSGESSSNSTVGRLSSLIYGTEEGREMDREIERSFSQTLARGKYVHSIVFHEVYPDKVEEYVELVSKWYPRMAGMPENKVNLVGSWRTEVGDNDTFVHIWEYQRYTGYHASLHSIQSHPDFPAFDKKLKTLIRNKRTSLMQEFRFWPTSPPRQLGGVFELRSYRLNPGTLLEWETHWQKGLAARREVMEGVGAWFVQVGELNTVHHLWQFADLEERRNGREQSWGVSGWADTVHKTVPLIQNMESRIMVPMPWSPVS